MECGSCVVMLVGGVTWSVSGDQCQCSGQRGEGPVQLRPRTEEDASTQYDGGELICFYKIHQDSVFHISS